MQQQIRPSQSITCHIMMITMYQIIVSYSMYPCFIVQRLFSTHTHTHIYIYIYIHIRIYIYIYISKLEIIWASLPVVVCLDLLQTWSGQIRTMQVAVPPVSFLVVNCSDTWPVCFVSSHFLLFHWIPLPMRFLLVTNPITLVLPHRDLKLNAHLSTGLAKRLLYIAPYSPISHHTTSYSTCAS